jgi:tRNA pseudouridine55 synthase
MTGIIVMDKPEGFTSFDVVAVMRGICRERKIGHTGTLDPMATGVLPLLLGAATRALPLLPDTDKEYEAGFRLGLATDTQDSTGKTIAESSVRATREQLEAVLPRFRGDILQTPPMYSAVSVNGQRLYDLARRGVEVERAKRPITVFRLELTEFDEAAQSGRLSISCSKGTYIRTLCADVGEALGTYGVMTSLRRTFAAGYSLCDAVTLEQAKALAADGRIAERLLPVESLFTSYPTVTVSAAQSVRFSNGGALDLSRTSLRNIELNDGSRFRVLSPEKLFLGLGEVRGTELAVLRLFPSEDGTK